MEPILHKALEKAPENRYQSAADLLSDLRRRRRRVETSAGDTHSAVHLAADCCSQWLRSVSSPRWQPVGGGCGVDRSHLSSGTRVLIGSVANGTNDPDFDGTLRQALTVLLGQTPFLDLVSDERVRQILRMMGREPGAPLTHAVAREACERIGASALIEGSVSAVGRTTVVALSASDCTTGDTIARDQVEVEHKEDVLKAVGVIASSMRRSLGESGRSLEQHNVPIQEATTPSLDALKAFTAGVEKRAAGSEIESIPFFERAISLDRNFALAYTTLSSIYGGLGETGRGEDYARLAYEHRSTVSERERLFITYQYHDRVTGDQLKTREALEVWKQTYPLDYRPANALALQLLRLGEYDRAIAEAQEALRLNPAHPFPYSNLAYALRGAGRYPEAKRTAERAVALGIETVPTRRLLYQLAEMDDDQPEAQRHLDWARSRPRGFDLVGAQAQVMAFHGQMNEARRLFQLTMEEANRSQLVQIASGYSAQLALTDALYGYAFLAMERARQIPETSLRARAPRGGSPCGRRRAQAKLRD